MTEETKDKDLDKKIASDLLIERYSPLVTRPNWSSGSLVAGPSSGGPYQEEHMDKIDEQTIKRVQQTNPEIKTMCNLALSALRRHEAQDPFGGTPHSTVSMMQSTDGGWDYVLELAAHNATSTTLIDAEGATMTFDHVSGEVTIRKNGQDLASIIVDALEGWMMEHPEAGLYYDGWSVQREPAEIVDFESVRNLRQGG